MSATATLSTLEELRLDRSHIVEMLGDPQFYVECPHFLWMRRTCLQTHAAYLATNRDLRVMQPMIETFFMHLNDLHQLDPALIREVHVYLERKKGLGIDSIVVHYRAAPGAQIDTLQF